MTRTKKRTVIGGIALQSNVLLASPWPKKAVWLCETSQNLSCTFTQAPSSSWIRLRGQL